MKKSSIIITVLAATVIVGGGILMAQKPDLFARWTNSKKNRELSVQEKQLAYLKEHEEEIKDFVETFDSKIESVRIDWKQTKWEEVGNGTPQGGGEVIRVGGSFNNMKDSTWSVLIDVIDGQPDMDSMMQGSPLRAGGKIFE